MCRKYMMLALGLSLFFGLCPMQASAAEISADEMQKESVEETVALEWSENISDENEENENSSAGEVAINEENFPDAIFRQYVLDECDKDKDNVLSAEEIESVSIIEVEKKGISSLKGIEYLTALAELRCDDNQLSSLDVRNNTELRFLTCSKNHLSSLDVRSNIKLGFLTCSKNQLSSLDISDNVELVNLGCDNNQLSSLDVRSNTKLKYLSCYMNQLSSLDVSNNADLEEICCYGNRQLNNLDVSKNAALKRLLCYGNQMSNLDVSNNKALVELDCSHNQLSSLDVSQNTELEQLRCFDNQLSSLDVSQNTELTWLHCERNTISDLDISKNTKLNIVGCDENLLSIFMSQNLKLEKLHINLKNASIDMSKYDSQFDSSKVSNLENLALTGNTFTILEGKSYGTYEYNCGQDQTLKVTLQVINSKPNQPVNPTPGTSFTDIPASAYYAAPVQWAVEKGITTGTSTTTFSPDKDCTRSQIVTFLWRAAGCPEPKSSANPFADVKSNAYYYKAVLWAVEQGITSGTSTTTFSPEQVCTRAQAVTFIYRYEGKPDMSAAANSFTDIAGGQYYYQPVLWAVKEGITNGTSTTTFSPQNNCTRGQIVTFLYRNEMQ